MVTLAASAAQSAAGVIVDRVLGEPPSAVHPVVAFGRVMRACEGRIYADTRLTGAGHAAFGVAVGATCGWALSSGATATWLAVGGRRLGQAAGEVDRALAAGDLEGARALLPALVGRDTAGLEEKEICRAVVESVAENTVDAVVAPAFWSALLGGTGALAYRAVNTLDAMVGHRTARYGNYGWASARLDDCAGWVPARLTAALVAVARPQASPDVWRAVRTQASAHPSPNAGVAEAAFAAALGLRLGGASSYGGRTEIRPELGFGRPPERADIARAVRLLNDVTWALAAALTVAGLAGRRR